MTAADRLAEIEARIEAATEGPWTVLPDSADWDVPILDAAGSFICCSPDDGVRGGHLAQDAAFIAHARTDLPATVKALRAVLELADEWAAAPSVGATQSEQFEFDYERVHAAAVRRTITEALGGAS